MQVTTPNDSDELVEALVAASRALVGIAARSLAGTEDVTLSQWRALVLVDTGERTTVSGLAEALEIHPTSATRLCDRLVAKGLLVRNPSHEDRRQILLDLTARGRRLVDRVTERRRAALREVVERMDSGRRRAMAEALESFVAEAGERFGPDEGLA